MGDKHVETLCSKIWCSSVVADSKLQPNGSGIANSHIFLVMKNNHTT